MSLPHTTIRLPGRIHLLTQLASHTYQPAVPACLHASVVSEFWLPACLIHVPRPHGCLSSPKLPCLTHRLPDITCFFPCPGLHSSLHEWLFLTSPPPLPHAHACMPGLGCMPSHASFPVIASLICSFAYLYFWAPQPV
jgi:hypothetical protein